MTKAATGDGMIVESVLLRESVCESFFALSFRYFVLTYFLSLLGGRTATEVLHVEGYFLCTKIQQNLNFCSLIFPLLGAKLKF